MKKLVLIILFGLVIQITQAQENTTDSLTKIELGEITIKGNLWSEYGTGLSTKIIKKATIETYNSHTTAEMLRQEGNVYFKQYGDNLLSSPSIRGTSSNHVLITWNGLTLKSPMNGGTDIALLSNAIIDDVTLVEGGSSSIHGNGAIGGSIHLENKRSKNSNINLMHGIGSFGKQITQVQGQIIGEKSNYVLRYSHQEAINDFEYVNDFKVKKPTEKRINNGYRFDHLVLEHYYQLSKENELITRYWYNENQRQLPGAISVSLKKRARSQEKQEDIAHRGMIEWKNFQHDRWENHLTFGHFYEKLNYTSDLGGITPSHWITSQVSNRTSFHVSPKISLQTVVDGGRYFAFQPNYKNFEIIRFQTGLFTGMTWRISPRLVQNIGIKQEWYQSPELENQQQFSPLSPSYQLRYEQKSFHIKTALSRNYRLPNFNDLYWAPEGNPNLLPENGISTDLSGGVNLFHKKLTINSSLFYLTVDNWIAWTPTGQNWSPKNINKVDSKGGSVNIKYNTTKYYFSVQYNHTKTTYTASNNESDIGHQLTYVPLHQGVAQVMYQPISFLKIKLLSQYNGKIYTTSTNTEFIDPATLWDTIVTFEKELFNTNMALDIQCKNILNTNYSTISGYPMPGRSFLVTLKIGKIFEQKTN